MECSHLALYICNLRVFLWELGSMFHHLLQLLPKVEKKAHMLFYVDKKSFLGVSSYVKLWMPDKHKKYLFMCSLTRTLVKG